MAEMVGHDYVLSLRMSLRHPSSTRHVSTVPLVLLAQRLRGWTVAASNGCAAMNYERRLKLKAAEYTPDEMQRMLHDDYDLTSQPLGGNETPPIDYHQPKHDEDLFDYYECYWGCDDERGGIKERK